MRTHQASLPRYRCPLGTTRMRCARSRPASANPTSSKETEPTMTMTKARTSFHPALHLESQLASVGLLDPAGKPMLIMRRPGELPQRVFPQPVPDDNGRVSVGGRLLHPNPVSYPPLTGRWPADDLAVFCEDGAAPSFAECLADTR